MIICGDLDQIINQAWLNNIYQNASRRRLRLTFLNLLVMIQVGFEYRNFRKFQLPVQYVQFFLKTGLDQND